jgi:hypothetical protein
MRFVFLEEDQVRFDAASMFKLHIVSSGLHDANRHQTTQTESVQTRFKSPFPTVVFEVSILSDKF